MYKANHKFMGALLIFYIFVGVAVGLILYYLYPEHYFGLYPAIPACYTILGFILLRALSVYKRNNPKKMINVYMMMRGIKFLITVASVLLYVLITDKFDYEFSITTIGFYFFYLFVETFIYIKFEKEKPANEPKI